MSYPNPAGNTRRAAVFDVDGTLIRGSAERVFLAHLLRARALCPGAVAAWLSRLVRGVPSRDRMVLSNKQYLAGLPAGYVGEAAAAVYEATLRARVSKTARAEVRAHQHSGRAVVLLSGMPDFLLDRFALDLGAEMSIGCRIEMRHGRLTGEILGPHPYGARKRTILLDEARRTGLDLALSIGYGNCWSDRHFLGILGAAVAVNPDPRLRRHAVSRGWTVMDDGQSAIRHDRLSLAPARRRTQP